ncbi:Calx-beta domain-containing protein, partial [Stieleria tagensis]|uniref:Calx-beta domain-containing protein n=1 Tax=Stieleria tagensis TaxID=2956795 RepID=UPI00209B8518
MRRRKHRHLAEQLEQRQMLAADLEGDSIASAFFVALTPGTMVELDATIGDGNHASKDVDLFRVDMTSGQSIEVDVDGSYFDDGTYGGLPISYLRVFDSSGMQLQYNSSASSSNDFVYASYDSYLSFTAPSTASYYIGVSSGYNSSYNPNTPGSGSYGPTGPYKLQLLANGSAAPSLSVGDVVIAENAGIASFQLTLSQSLGSSVTLDFVTGDGTALATSDYSATSGSLTFAAGETSKSVQVSITDDSDLEAEETFDLTVFNVTGVAVLDATGVATIQDNETPPVDLPGDHLSDAMVLSLQANVQEEINEAIGDGDFAASDVDLYRFDLIEGQSLSIDVDAHYYDDQTMGGLSNSFLRVFDNVGTQLQSNNNASSSNDYYAAYNDSYLNFTAANSGTFYFGVSSYYNTSYDPTTEGTGHSGPTGDYKLQLLLSPPPGPALTFSDTIVDEDASSVVFQVSLSEPISDPVTLDYRTEDVTAVAPGDYTSKSGLLYFSPGETIKSVVVPILDDGVSEFNETFRLVVSNVYGAAISRNFATATIDDNDALPQDVVGDTMSISHVVTFDTNEEFEFDGYVGNGTSGAGDVDMFRIDLAFGEELIANADSDGRGLDSYLRLFNSSGAAVAFNDNNGGSVGSDALLSYVTQNSGTYYLGVSSAGNQTYSPTNTGSNTSGETSGPFHLSLSKATFVDTPEIEVYIGGLSISQGDTIDLGAFAQGASPNRKVKIINKEASAISLVEPINVSTPAALINSFENNPLGASDGLNDGFDTTVFEIQLDAQSIGDVSATVSFGVGPGNFSFTLQYSVYQPSAALSPDDPITIRSRLNWYSTDQDETLVVTDPGFLANDIDNENDSLKAAIVSQPRFGTLVVNDTGAFEYTPFPGFSGTDSFRYRAFDDSDSADVQHGPPISVTIEVLDTQPTLLDINEKPAVIQVNSAADVTNPTAGAITLREAVSQASSNGAEKTIIKLPETLGSIRLLLGEIVIGTNIEIEGSTSGTEIWTDGDFRLFRIEANANARFSDLILAGRQVSGDPGRTATNLSGGAVYNSGTLDMQRVFAHGHSLVGSSARRGGAVFNANGATLSISESTLTDNFAAMDGGAVYNSLNGTLFLLNTTISGNTAAVWGGGVYSVGDAEIISSTLAENKANTGANFASLGSVSSANSIFYSGISSSDFEGQIASLGGNIVGDATDATGFSMTLGDQYGDSSSPLDPLLGPLQFNGGMTPTHMPLVGSPTIDQGVDVYSYADQRGAARVVDGLELGAESDMVRTIDVGAVEFGTFFVNSLDDWVDATPLGDGRVDIDLATPGDQVSLRAAVQEHSALAGSYSQPSVATGAYEATILFDGNADLVVPLDLRGADEERSQTGDLDLYGNIEIRGSLVDGATRQVTVQGTWQEVLLESFNHDRESFAGFDRVFHVHPNSIVELASLQIADGVAMFGDGHAGGGGVLNDAGTLFLVETFVNDNFADFGGGVFSAGATTVVERGSSVESNFAADGAGFYLESGEASFFDSTLEHNLYSRYGGGIFVASGNAYVGDGTAISRNELQAQSDDGSTMHNNAQDGAAIYLHDGDTIIDRASIRANGGLSSYTYVGADILAHYTDRIEDAFYQSNEILVDVDARLDVHDSHFADQYDIRFLNSSAMIDNYFAPMVILNSGTTTVSGSTFSSNERLFANFRTGNMTIRQSEFLDNKTQRYTRSAANHMYLPSIDGLAGPGEGTWLDADGNGSFPYAQLYGEAPLLDASIQNLGGKVTIVDSGFRGTADGPIEYQNLARHSIVNLGVTAEMEIVRTMIDHNLSDTYPVLLNENGTLEFRDSTFSNNYSTGLEWRWNSPIHHLGHGEFLGSVEDFEPVLTQEAGVDGNGDPEQTLHVSSAKGFLGLDTPFEISVNDDVFMLNSVDEVTQTLDVTRVNSNVIPTNTVVANANIDADYRVDGLHVNGAVGPDDHQVQVVNIDPFLRFSLPLEIAIGSERMTVLEIDPSSSTLTVDRPFPRPIDTLERITLYTENSSELLVDDVDSYQHHSFPMDVIIAVYDEDRNLYTPFPDQYSLHQRLYPPEDALPPLAQMVNSEVERVLTDTRGGNTAVKFPSIKPRVSAMEVVTVTGIDPSRGVLHIERGRRGTIPIRFDQGAHLWALPGGMTVTNSTISDNAVLPNFYINGTVDPPTDSTYYNPDQAVLRSVVTDFAPSTVIENSTFADSGSYGKVASVSAIRTSMFAGDNPTRYANYDYRFYQPVDPGGDEAGWAEHGFLDLGEKFVQDTLGLVIENSVLTGASVHHASTGFGTGEMGELPESQRFQNYIESLMPDERIELELLKEWAGASEEGEEEEEVLPGNTVPVLTLQSAWIESPTNIPSNLDIPRLALLFVDDDNVITDAGFTSQTAGQPVATGFAGDSLSFENSANPTEVKWNFQQVPAGVYEVAIPLDSAAPIGFPVEFVNDANGNQLLSLTFDALTRALSPIDISETRITFSDEFRPGLRIQVGSEQLRVLSVTDNLNGTITYDVQRGAYGTSAQSYPVGTEAIAFNRVSYDPLTRKKWLVLHDSLPVMDTYIDPQYDPEDESKWEHLPSDLTVKMLFPAGEGIADAVRLRQISHTVTPAILETLEGLDTTPSGNDSVDGAVEGLYDFQTSLAFTEAPMCDPAGSMQYQTTTHGESTWQIDDVPKGRHYILASWPATNTSPLEITNDSSRDHSWYLAHDFMSNGGSYEISLPGSPPSGVEAAVCVTHTANIIDRYQAAYLKNEEPPEENRYEFNTPSISERLRKIADDSHAVISGNSTLEDSASSFAGSHTVLHENAIAEWTFSGLASGVYFVSSSYTSTLPFSIYADDELVSQGQLNPDGSRYYSYRDLEYDFATGDSPDGSFEESFRDNEYYLKQSYLDRYLGVSIPAYEPERQQLLQSHSQRWIALDRVTTAEELTVQIHGTIDGIPADAIRIEQIASGDADLAILSDHGDGLGGRRANNGSPIVDQASETLLFGISDRLASHLTDDYHDNRLYVQNPERFLRTEANLDVPDFPYEITIGSERLSVRGWDSLEGALIVERGLYGTGPQFHPQDHPLNYGFAGQRIQLLEQFALGETSVLVQPFHIPKARQFEVQVMDERMLVTDVIDNFDGTYTIDVIRSARGTQGISDIPATATLFLAVDQMGANRFVDGDHRGSVAMDFGAVESLSIEITSSTADIPDVDAGDGMIATANGDRTLRAAVMEANAFGGKAVIQLSSGTYSLAAPDILADEATGDIDITGFVSIVGSGSHSTIIDAQQLDRVFEIHPGGILYLEGVQVTGGVGGLPGGAVYVDNGTFHSWDSVFINNAASDGGAIYAESSNISLGRVSLIDNQTTGTGGGLYLSQSTAVIKNTTFSGNAATADAGAVYVSKGSDIDLEFVTIAGNQAPQTSGIISEGKTAIRSSLVGGNTLSVVDSADIKGNFISAGYNFIGALGQQPTQVYDVDIQANTVTVTDPFGLPQVPFGILVNEHSFTATRVVGNVIHINESLQIASPVNWTQIPPGTEVRFDSFWNNDKVGTPQNVLDPLLLPLNSGTWTHTPDVQSPLIDSGPVAEGKIQLTDQRGSVRYVDMAYGNLLPSDIGALEITNHLAFTQNHVIRQEKGIGQTQYYDFELTRSDSSESLAVSYKVSGVGLDPAGIDDFVGGLMPKGRVVFAPGETSKTITIAVAGDDHFEYNEQFQLQISGISRPVTLNYPTVGATIVSDEVLIDSMQLVISEPQNADQDVSGDYSVGDTLTYDFTLTNTGTVAQRYIEITATPVDLDSESLSYLLGGEGHVFTGTHIITQADMDGGTIQILAEVITEHIIDDPIEAETTTVVALIPSLAIDFAEPQNADNDASGSYSTGDFVTFTVMVTNDGPVPQTNVQVSTNLGGSLISWPLIDPGETFQQTFTYQVTSSDSMAGGLTLSVDVVSDSTSIAVTSDNELSFGSSSGGSGSSGGGGGSGSSGPPDDGSGSGAPPNGGSSAPDYPPPPGSGSGEGNDQVVVFYHGDGTFSVTTCGEAYGQGSDPLVCNPKSYDDSKKRDLNPPDDDESPPDTSQPIQWVTHEDQVFPERLTGTIGDAETIDLEFQQGVLVETYEVSHRGELTFNPIPSYSIPDSVQLSGDFEIKLKLLEPSSGWVNEYETVYDFYQDGDDVNGTIDITKEEEHLSVPLEHVRVNSDNTVTFTPQFPSAFLEPRRDANGNVYRYDLSRPIITSLWVDYSDPLKGDVQIGSNIVSEVLIKDDLPVFRGDRMHRPEATTAKLYSEPVRVELGSTARIDLNDLLYDPDGDPILIAGFNDGSNYAVKTRGFKLGDTQSADVHEPVDGYLPLVGDINPTANQRASDATWQDDDGKFLIASFAGSTVQLHNQLSIDDVNSSMPSATRWNGNTGAETIFLDVLLAPTVHNPVRVLQIEIDPAKELPVGEEMVDQPTQSWVSTVDGATVVGGSVLSGKEQLIQVDAVDVGYNRSFELVGDTPVDLVGGSFLVSHPLPLDGSGGTSELSLPGLIYDSSTVHLDGKQVPVIQAEIRVPDGMEGGEWVDATLTWYDAFSEVSPESPYGNEITSSDSFSLNFSEGKDVVALPVGQAPTQTGLYNWKLELQIGGSVYTNYGQTAVIVHQGDDAIFGDGWALEGVPTLNLDRYDGGVSHSLSWNRDGFDDRLILSFPGAEPIIFDYSDLTVADLALPMVLPTIQAGSKSSGMNRKGFEDARRYGTLTARHDPFDYDHPETHDAGKPDELVYKTPDGTEYIFYRWEVDGEIQYLINRIEQPGIDFDPETSPSAAQRRGVSFERETATQDRGDLTAIVASDGQKVLLNRTGDVVTQFELENLSYTVNLEYTSQNGSQYLHQINHNNSVTGGSGQTTVDRIRQFDYTEGQLTNVRWVVQDSLQTVNTKFTYSRTASDALLGLAKITIGGPTNQLLTDIVPAALAGMVQRPAQAGGVPLDPLVAKTVTVSGFEKLDENWDAQPISGDKEIRYTMNLHGHLGKVESLFANQTLTTESWERDVLGNPVVFTSSDQYETRYRYDYQIAPTYQDTDPGTADGYWQYDPDDYRGNLTHRSKLAATDVFHYETDDEQLDALGLLITSGTVSAGVWTGRTEYTRQVDGRLTKKRTIRGGDQQTTNEAGKDAVETWEYHPVGEDGNIGRLKQSIDTRGLETDYVYRTDGKLEKTTVKDSEYSENHETHYGYDTLGFINEITSKDSGAIVGVTNFVYDKTGLNLASLIENDYGTILQAQEFEYNADGRVVATVAPLFNATAGTDEDVREVWKYNDAGMLTEHVAAQSAAYRIYSSSSLTSVDVSRTTKFEYYNDGTLKKVFHDDGDTLDGITTQYYFDPVSRSKWVSHNQIAGDIGFADEKHITKSILNDFGEIRETQFNLTNDTTVTGVNEKSYQSSYPTQTTIAGLQPFTANGRIDSNGLGQTTVQKDPLTYSTSQYDELGFTTKLTDHRYQTPYLIVETNAAGDVLKQTESRFTPDGSGGYTKQDFETTFKYDERGRLRETKDPLATVEPGTAAATIDYQYESSFDPSDPSRGGATKVIATSRTGEVTIQWLDAADQLVRSKNAAGAITDYQYDKGGRLIGQTIMPSESGLPTANVEFQYDQRGRLRNTVTMLGSHTIFNAVDYFDYESPYSGWHQIEYVTLAGDGSGIIPSEHRLRRATRTRIDSQGSPIIVQVPDPNDIIASDDVPTTIYYYDYSPGSVQVETASFPATNHYDLSLPTPSDTSQVRKTRTLRRSDGVLINSEYWEAVTDHNGTLQPANWVLEAYNNYDEVTGRLETSFNGAGHGTDYSYDPLTGQISQIDSPNGEVIQFHYDSAGNRTRLAYDTGVPIEEGQEPTEGGGDTQWQYDALNRPTSEIALGATGARTWQYEGNATKYNDRIGVLHTTVVDPAAGTVTIDAADGTLQYDRVVHYTSVGGLESIFESLVDSGATVYDSFFQYDNDV